MAKLTDLQLASLLDEIACAMRSQTPVIDAMQRLRQRRLGRVGRIAGRIADRLQRGEALSQAVVAMGSGASSRAVAGLLSCQVADNPQSLQRMAVLLRQRAHYAAQRRLSWLYPIILLAVGYAIAVGVMRPLVLRFQGSDLRWPAEVIQVADWLGRYGWLPPLVGLIVLVVIAVMLTARDGFSRQMRLSLFCHALADQLARNVPQSEAIRAAAELAGDRALLQLSEPTLQSPEVQRLIAMPTPWPQIPSQDVAAMIAQLRYLAVLHADRFRRRAYFWSRLLPRATIVVVGVSMAFLYVGWVIAPVYRSVAKW